MPKATDAKEALKELFEEIKLFRGLRGPAVETMKGTEARPGYSAFFSSDPHVASTYANPLSPDTIEDWDSPLAVFPLRARPKKIIEFPVKPYPDGKGNQFDKFAFDQAASQLKPGEALVARNVYDYGPRANLTADPDRKYSYPSDIWALGPDVETTPLHKAKGGKVGALETALQYAKNKLPQTGFFSTLDELIANAPFERAPYDQWQKYLQPGRTLEREGVRFPLKKEELDYSKLDDLAADALGDKPVTKDDLRDYVRRNRPDLSMRINLQPGSRAAERLTPEFGLQQERQGMPLLESARYPDYAHPTTPGGYEESVTRSPEFGEFHTHFGPLALSHSRTTMQPTADQKLMRLIEEIQSDRHQAAADRPLITTPEQDRIFEGDSPWAVEEANRLKETLPRGPRTGYRTPEESRELTNLEGSSLTWSGGNQNLEGALNTSAQMRKRIHELQAKPPDAPFKDPADYGMLEMKQQLLQAVKQNADYLGLVRGADVSDRFSHGPREREGTAYTYDKVYQSALDKLARQYGIERSEVPVNVQKTVDVATPTMRDLDTENVEDFLDMISDRLASDREMEIHREDAATNLNWISRVSREMHGTDPEADRQVRDNVRQMKQIIASDDRGDDPDTLPEYSPKFQDLWLSTAQALKSMHQAYSEPRLAAAARETKEKVFPALNLTPEVRQKILKAGIPIWALGATGAVGSMMQDENQGYAEGGEVKPVPSLRWLGKIARMMATGDTGIPDPEKQKRLALLAAGLASQVYGLDYEGNPKFLGDYSRQGHMATDASGREYWVPSENPHPPGLVDETVALGTLLGSHAPESSKQAEERLAVLKQRILDEMGLEAPHGFGENTAMSLGTMLGQLPVGGGEAVASKVVPTVAGKLARLGKTAIKAPIEWFSPTVVPSASNYASGALFGGALGTLVEDTPDDKSLEDMIRDTEVKKKAEGGSIKASIKPLQAMLAELRARLDELTPDAPLSAPRDRIGALSEGLEMAKGGKVSMAAKLIEKMKQLGLDWEHPSLYKDNGDLDIAEARDFIDSHLEGVEETGEDLAAAGLSGLSPEELTRRIEELTGSIERGDEVVPSPWEQRGHQLAELGRQMQEQIKQQKLANTKLSVANPSHGRIELEHAEPVAGIPGSFEGLGSFKPTKKALLESLSDYFEEAGMPRSHARQFSIYQDPVFLETDSNNPAHAGAYWTVGYQGPKSLVDELKKALRLEDLGAGGNEFPLKGTEDEFNE